MGRDAEKEEAAKVMLLDKMELFRVEKYMHLPLTHIKKLAKRLGMLLPFLKFKLSLKENE